MDSIEAANQCHHNVSLISLKAMQIVLLISLIISVITMGDYTCLWIQLKLLRDP